MRTKTENRIVDAVKSAIEEGLILEKHRYNTLNYSDEIFNNINDWPRFLKRRSKISGLDRNVYHKVLREL